MRTNFYSSLYINDDGTQVIADGPFDWEDSETGSCHIKFTITQGNVHATGRSGNYHRPDPTWDGNANAQGGTFVPGPASAAGEIVGDIQPPPDPWPPQNVELVLLSRRQNAFPATEATTA